jgi:hypothetical protein
MWTLSLRRPVRPANDQYADPSQRAPVAVARAARCPLAHTVNHDRVVTVAAPHDHLHAQG